MPRTKQTKPQGFLSQIKWGESYTSLFLGAVVVVIILILLFSFLKARSVINQNSQQTSSTSTKAELSVKPKTYTVKQGDDLWTISQNIYGSGYNWVDLAKDNNLQNPDILYPGTKLSVPDVKPKIIETQTVITETKISGNSYTVVKGDCLWTIAVRAYGNGYKWVQIASANKLTNPDLIYPGNIFSLPR